MTSTAISAQKTKLFLETGTGAAKNITGILPGNPTIITSVAHGQLNGNVAALAAITGTIGAALNGKSFPITNITADTFAVQVDTTGLVYTAAGTATPATYTQVKNVKTFNGFDGTSSEIDVTNFDSDAKEFLSGLQDFGKITFDINPDFSDAGQTAMRAIRATGTKKNWQLQYPNGLVASFLGFVKSTPQQGAVDAALSGTFEVRITGIVTIA